MLPRNDCPDVQAYASAERRLFRRFEVDARERTLAISEPNIRVQILEVAGEGTPMVFLHGGSGPAAKWAPLARELRGRHLILVDRPGCGRTDFFDYTRVDVRYHAVGFVRSVLDALGLKRAILVGNSMGGLWALWFAIQYPERVDTTVLLGCPALFLGTTLPWRWRLLTLAGVRRALPRRKGGGVDQARKRMAFVAGEHAAAHAVPELVEVAALASRLPGSRESFLTLLATVSSLFGAHPRYAFTEEDLRQVHVPTLLLWGRDDVFGNTSVPERARAVLPTLAVETLAAGHLPWLDDARGCARAIDGFLDLPAGRRRLHAGMQ